jgi:hypothetical protein
MNLTKIFLLSLSLIWFVTAPCLLCLLPLLYSILLLHRSTSILCSFSSCAQHMLFIFSSSFYTLCFLCILFTAPWISPLDYELRLILPTCITIEKNTLSYLFCMSFSCQVLYLIIKQTLRLPWWLCCLYSSSVVIIQRFFGSLTVILNLFITNGCYPEILWILWQSQFFIFFANYSQSFLDSLASNPLPSCDHQQCPYAY